MKNTFIAFIVVVMLCLSTPIASADYYRDDTFTIPLDSWKVLSLWGARGGILQIDVDVLTDGAGLDILLMDKSNWNLYNTTKQEKTFEYYSESKLNINKISFKFTAPVDGELYIVLDNTFYPKEGGAYGTDDVEVHVVVKAITHAPSIGMIGIALGLGIAFIVVTVKRRSKVE